MLDYIMNCKVGDVGEPFLCAMVKVGVIGLVFIFIALIVIIFTSKKSKQKLKGRNKQ